jgi:hypothetical protein
MNWHHTNDSYSAPEKFELNEQQMIEVEMANLSVPKEKPKTFLELHEMLYKAFELGKKWQQEKEVRK